MTAAALGIGHGAGFAVSAAPDGPSSARSRPSGSYAGLVRVLAGRRLSGVSSGFATAGFLAGPRGRPPHGEAEGFRSGPPDAPAHRAETGREALGPTEAYAGRRGRAPVAGRSPISRHGHDRHGHERTSA